MLGKLKESLYEQYSEHFTYATRVRGRLKANGASCECLFVMPRNSEVEHYLLAKLFGNEWCKVGERRIWIRQATRYARQLPCGVDFCVAALPLRWSRLFAPLAEISTLPYLRQSIDMTGDWAEIKGRFRSKSKRTDFNKFSREQEFSFRISRDDSDFVFFYHRMYLPHVRKFGRAAKILSQEFMRESYFKPGFVMMVQEDGVDVAGALNFIEGDTMHCLSDGAVDGDPALVKRGVLSALYVAVLRYAKEQDVRIVDLGLTRPFLGDGVYRHKRSWGASVSLAEDQYEAIYLFDPAQSANVRAFLEQNPLVVTVEEERLMGLCLLGEATRTDEKQLERILEDNCAPGLSGMIVLDADNQTRYVFPFPDQYRESIPPGEGLLSSQAAQ